MFDSCLATNFSQAWQNCALNQTSVDNILISIDTAGQSNGTLSISGGTSSEPSNAGWDAVASLEAKGWTVAVNGVRPTCDLPPYACDTDVNPYCVTNFSGAWQNCTSLTSFPLLDVSSGTNFDGAWLNCASLTSFPELDVSSGTNFFQTWQNCSALTSFPLLDVSNGIAFFGAWQDCESLTSFPLLNVSNGTSFAYAWSGCTSLTSFPLLNVSSGTIFGYAWQSCTSLTSFPAEILDSCLATNFTNAWQNCALNQTSVDNILVSLDIAGQSDGTVTISGGTSAAPGTAGLAAKASLQAKGWTVITN